MSADIQKGERKNARQNTAHLLKKKVVHMRMGLSLLVSLCAVRQVECKVFLNVWIGAPVHFCYAHNKLVYKSQPYAQR